MRVIRLSFASLVGAAILSWVCGYAPLSAAALFEENFDKLPTGPLSADAHEAIIPWEGTFEREYGHLSVEPAPAGPDARSHGKTVALHDNTSAAAKAASLQLRWAPAESVSLSWDVVIVAEEPFLGIHFVGNDWNDSAAIVIFSGGSISIQHAGGDTDRAVVGTYRPGQWRSVRLELDGGTKTFDAYLDGKKVLSRHGWQRAATPELSRLSVVADYSTTERDGAAVLHLDNIRAAPLSGRPAPAKVK